MKQLKENKIMYGIDIVQRPHISMTGKKRPTRSAQELVAAHAKALDKLAKM